MNFFDFRSEVSTVSNNNSKEGKAACRIQAAFRAYMERKKLKNDDPRKYKSLVRISKKIRRRLKNSGRTRALNMFTPSKNRMAERTM